MSECISFPVQYWLRVDFFFVCQSIPNTKAKKGAWGEGGAIWNQIREGEQEGLELFWRRTTCYCGVHTWNMILQPEQFLSEICMDKEGRGCTKKKRKKGQGRKVRRKELRRKIMTEQKKRDEIGEVYRKQWPWPRTEEEPVLSLTSDTGRNSTSSGSGPLTTVPDGLARDWIPVDTHRLVPANDEHQEQDFSPAHVSSQVLLLNRCAALLIGRRVVVARDTQGSPPSEACRNTERDKLVLNIMGCETYLLLLPTSTEFNCWRSVTTHGGLTTDYVHWQRRSDQLMLADCK